MRTVIWASVLILAGALHARADDPLAAFMRRVDAQAKSDIEAFHRTVSAQFGVPEVQVRAIFGKVHDPASVFMIFQLGHMSHQPIDRVLPVYESHKGKGWGAMAKQLGIKPGSAEFHALKNGDLHYGVPAPAANANGGGQGKGKAKGKQK